MGLFRQNSDKYKAQDVENKANSYILEVLKQFKDNINKSVHELEAALGNVYTKEDVYTKKESDAKYLTEHQDISGKADKDSVYTKEESDAKYLTEHQDISGKAEKNLSNVTNEIFKTKAEEAGIDSKVFLINIHRHSNGTITADKTFEEIATEVNSKKNVFAIIQIGSDEGAYIPLATYSEAGGMITFGKTIGTKHFGLSFFRSGNRWYYSEFDLAQKSTTLSGYGITDAYTKDEIASLMGDIETTLDNIASLQASYIGGATS